MSKYAFLSDEWFAVVEQLVEQHAPAAPQANVMINLVITDTPFGNERHMHMGSNNGTAAWGIGHADAADVTLTTDYATAKEVFISGDPQAGMQAFMGGKVKIQGDMSKLIAAQQAGGPGSNSALQQAIHGVTE